MSQNSVARHRCNLCSFETKTGSSLSGHRRFNHVGTICRWEGCNLKAGSEKALRAHIMQAHNLKTAVDKTNADGTIVRRYVCSWPGCGKDHLNYPNANRCAFGHVYKAYMRATAGGEQVDITDEEIDDETDEEDASTAVGEDESIQSGADARASREASSLPFPPKGQNKAATIDRVLEAVHALSAKVDKLSKELHDSAYKTDYIIDRQDDVETILYRLHNTTDELVQRAASRAGATAEQPSDADAANLSVRENSAKRSRGDDSPSPPPTKRGRMD
ncbi:hypothetical protein F4818DRAFT_443773 [Hypoxylon cercidicola]|nr:hypothetical protein F4818DRAFT_443773 [Hypoxylon cercidicola]